MKRLDNVRTGMRFLFVSLVLLLAPVLAAAQKTSDKTGKDRPILYDDATHRRVAIDAEAKKVFSDRFRIVETKTEAGYRPMHLKGRSHVFSDPRSMRLWRVPFKMTYTYVVTAEGRAFAPQVLQTTDKKTAEALTHSFLYDRYAPAELNGVPVACLEYGEVHFGGYSEDDNSYRDGLGIMGYRDR